MTAGLELGDDPPHGCLVAAPGRLDGEHLRLVRAGRRRLATEVLANDLVQAGIGHGAGQSGVDGLDVGGGPLSGTAQKEADVVEAGKGPATMVDQVVPGTGGDPGSDGVGGETDPCPVGPCRLRPRPGHDVEDPAHARITIGWRSSRYGNFLPAVPSEV